MTDASPPYAESLAFLLSQVGVRAAQLFAERIAPLGVSPRAFGVLGSLSTDGERTQQQLADALGIHRNNMVALIDELEASGWVRRHRRRQDRRAFEIRLTDDGRDLVTRVQALIPALDGDLTQSMHDRDRAVLRGSLQQIADTLGLAHGVHPYLGLPRRSTRAAAPPR